MDMPHYMLIRSSVSGRGGGVWFLVNRKSAPGSTPCRSPCGLFSFLEGEFLGKGLVDGMVNLSNIL